MNAAHTRRESAFSSANGYLAACAGILLLLGTFYLMKRMAESSEGLYFLLGAVVLGLAGLLCLGGLYMLQPNESAILTLFGKYIGTDRSELWTRDEFKAWSKKYFDAKSAWTFKATRRNVYASADKSLIWFDELLDTKNMGHAMASGVIRKTANGFEIVHYQLSLAVPNEVIDQVTGIIAEHEKKAKK